LTSALGGRKEDVYVAMLKVDSRKVEAKTFKTPQRRLLQT